MIQIVQISSDEAESLCRRITKDLPEYFGISEANEQYAKGVCSRMNLAAKLDNSDYVGLISIDFPYPNNSNLYWMGVLRAHQHKGIGKKLLVAACNMAKELDANSMTVETVSPSEADENYLKTYQFYNNNGFQPLFTLRPKGYDWNMIYMSRDLRAKSFKYEGEFSIRVFNKTDIPIMVDAFKSANWSKPISLFQQYLKELRTEKRMIWVAYVDNQFSGYITLKWESLYQPFKVKKIPEIMDLNVLPPFRKQGIGSRLLEIAEKFAAKKSSIVGLGVGLYRDYGSAQSIYVKRGYIPDGQGITYRYKYLEPDQSAPLDDDLILWLTKML